MDKLTDLSNALGSALQQHGYKLTLAESCTGGLVAAAITEIAGSSAWFDCGFVTYSNRAKEDILDVPTNILSAYGAVSEETASAMAQGALIHSRADIAASVTGVAGPTGGSLENPVGTVCFAWTTVRGHSACCTEHFTGNRQRVRHQSAIRLMLGLMQVLDNAR